MKKIIIFFFLFIINNANASYKETIIQNLLNTQNLTFDFEQNINEKVENRYQFPGRRKKLLWDGENMKITNFEMANQFIKRDYRKGW